MVLIIAKVSTKNHGGLAKFGIQFITPNAPMDAMAELWLPAGKEGPKDFINQKFWCH